MLPIPPSADASAWYVTRKSKPPIDALPPSGTDQNVPFLVFAFIDAALAIAVYLAVPYAVWATLALSALGLVGLTVTFNKPQREKTLDRVIWVVDALIVIYAAYLLFLA